MSAAEEPTLLFDGTYEVVDVLGESHLGTTVRVHHRGWGIDLAAAMPSPALLSWPTANEDVMKGVEHWVRLGFHPHIVCCFYVRPLENIPMIFRELVEGGSLADWIEDGRLYEGEGNAPLVRILDIATQIALAAGHAHKMGVVHQDIRPATVLMTPKGEDTKNEIWFKEISNKSINASNNCISFYCDYIGCWILNTSKYSC